MCIRIRVADIAAHAVLWDPLEVCVLVGSGTDLDAELDPVLDQRFAPGLDEHGLDEIAAVLWDLGARRTWSGFRCFCGEPILLPPELARCGGRTD